MVDLKVKMNEVVVPGQELASGMGYLPGQFTYRDGDKIRANKLGLVNVDGRAIKLVPLSGKYLPKRGDVIIGKIIDVTYNGWIVETNSAYRAMLSLKDATTAYIRKGADLTRYFNFGEYVVAKIFNVTSQNLIDLSMKGPGLRKLDYGMIIKVNPNKVPRIIGKEGSMVSMIKKETNCKIIVGQNGVVWLSGEPKNEILAVSMIRKIEREAHIAGLTEKIKVDLEKARKGG